VRAVSPVDFGAVTESTGQGSGRVATARSFIWLVFRSPADMTSEELLAETTARPQRTALGAFFGVVAGRRA
jgi:hypothetical protein